MRLSKVVPIAIGLFLLAQVVAGCSHRAGWLEACGGRIAKNQHERKAFEKKLAEWLLLNGFTATSDPGEISPGLACILLVRSPHGIEVLIEVRRRSCCECKPSRERMSVAGLRSSISPMRGMCVEVAST